MKEIYSHIKPTGFFFWNFLINILINHKFSRVSSFIWPRKLEHKEDGKANPSHEKIIKYKKHKHDESNFFFFSLRFALKEQYFALRTLTHRPSM